MVNPGDSISSALTDASAGDEIQVAAGSYSEPSVVVAKPNLTLRYLHLACLWSAAVLGLILPPPPFCLRTCRLMGEVVVTVQGADTEWLTIQGVSFGMLQDRLNLTGGTDPSVTSPLPTLNSLAGDPHRDWFG